MGETHNPDPCCPIMRTACKQTANTIQTLSDIAAAWPLYAAVALPVATNAVYDIYDKL